MFFITTLDPNDRTSRCVGYYTDFKSAEDVVLGNDYDINETCYKYAVIENIPAGVYQYDFEPKWYEWNEIDEIYERIDKTPKEYKNETGFAIG